MSWEDFEYFFAVTFVALALSGLMIAILLAFVRFS